MQFTKILFEVNFSGDLAYNVQNMNTFPKTEEPTQWNDLKQRGNFTEVHRRRSALRHTTMVLKHPRFGIRSHGVHDSDC
jgi:hypothetical protein